MGNVDFTQIANILEKDILPSVKVQVYKKAPLWEIFGGFAADEQGNVSESRVNTPQISFKNNTIYVTIQNGRPAVTNIATGEKFIYGTTPTDQGSITIATAVGAFIIPKAVLNIKAEGAIVNALQFNMKATANALAMDLNRQAYGDGTATLAYTSNSGTSTTTVSLVPKATASTLYNNDIPLAVDFFAIGLKIKIGSNAVTTVTGITGDNTITVADAQTFNQYDAVVKQSGSSTTATDFTGLAAIVNTTTYMGIDPTVDATWKGQVDTNGGAAKTFAVTDVDAIFAKANATGSVKFLLMNRTEFTKYGESLTSNVRFTRTEALSGGWQALEYMGNNAMVVLDYICPDDRIYVLSPEALMRAEYQALEFEPGMLQSGQRLVQQLDYEVVADLMGNFVTDLRSANGVLTNRVG